VDNDVLEFWFNELEPKQWFVKDRDLDAMIEARFSLLVEQARAGELFSWRVTPQGRLAEIILIDQFSRNIFRDKPESFSADPVALVLAQETIGAGADQRLDVQERAFLYMPFMHSESQAIHEQAVVLFDQPGLEYNLEFEHKHKAIVDRFGRYPHRNEILGRKSTEEEIAFLKAPGSSF
jgi:uncharacterized protein (DUF924 family)